MNMYKLFWTIGFVQFIQGRDLRKAFELNGLSSKDLCDIDRIQVRGEGDFFRDVCIKQTLELANA